MWLLLILFSPLVIKLLPSYNVKGDRHLGPKMGGKPGKQPQSFWGYPDLRNGIKAQGPSMAVDTTLWVTCSSEVSPLASSGQDSGLGLGTRDTSNWLQGLGCGCSSRPSGAQLHQLCLVQAPEWHLPTLRLRACVLEGKRMGRKRWAVILQVFKKLQEG